MTKLTAHTHWVCGHCGNEEETALPVTGKWCVACRHPVTEVMRAMKPRDESDKSDYGQ